MSATTQHSAGAQTTDARAADNTRRTATAIELPDLTTPRAQVLLALGDDNLVAGHRAGHWTGVAPSLEEDLAFSTIAQDGVNHADVWYQVLVGRDHPRLRACVDAVGLGREPGAYRHAIALERPPRDFALTLATHWAYERFDAVRLAALVDSLDADVAAVARKLLHESRYHLEHADHWFAKLSRGGDDAHRRFGEALEVVLPEALGLAEAVPGEDEAVDAGLLPAGHRAMATRWLEIASGMLDAAGYGELIPSDLDAVPEVARGGRVGRHSADFTEDVWPEMTVLYRAHPGARW